MVEVGNGNYASMASPVHTTLHRQYHNGTYVGAQIRETTVLGRTPGAQNTTDSLYPTTYTGNWGSTVHDDQSPGTTVAVTSLLTSEVVVPAGLSMRLFTNQSIDTFKVPERRKPTTSGTMTVTPIEYVGV